MIYSNVMPNHAVGQVRQSYGERLGWKADERVVIFHIDDAGMSYESNEGTRKALDFSIATSVSVMIPCPWTADIVKTIRENPKYDAGIHLTHTAEWEKYRWRPLLGDKNGLCDHEGYFWSNVEDVLSHASTQEVRNEIKQQISNAKQMGFIPTHLDTHMGTMWASPQLLELYKRISIEEKIPVLIPAGHNSLMRRQMNDGPLSRLYKLSDSNNQTDILNSLHKIGESLWNEGLPVVDDLYLSSYDWTLPDGMVPTDPNLMKFKTDKYKELLNNIKPGITVILIHCTDADSTFGSISDSWITRRGDFLSMTDALLKSFIQEQKIVLTTWRELSERRSQIKSH